MSLRLKVFIGYCIFVLLCGYFIGHSVSQEIKPAVRQTTEETLVDTAYLLAELLRETIQKGQLAQSDWPNYLKAYGARRLDADIWGIHKYSPSHRVYVTDVQGRVILDSHGEVVGEDYSHWRDVALTLRGGYGARSTQELINGELTSVMYVAAPIKDGEKMLGVVTVSKPSTTVAPYIERSQTRLAFIAAIIIVLGIVGGGVFSWALGRELQRLREHAEALSQGQTAPLLPNKLGSRELRYLGEAMDAMRRELDGKNYIEQYVQSLTHELKTPLASLAASSELLAQAEGLTAAQTQQLYSLIQHQTRRLQITIDAILQLAQLEADENIHAEIISVSELVAEISDTFNLHLVEKQCSLVVDSAVKTVWGGRNLLLMALNNLIANALAFAVKGTPIRLSLLPQGSEYCQITVTNNGPNIPDYAQPRITERFYSLPRPDGTGKSTGLGLNFVAAIARRHGANLTLVNISDGVSAQLNHWPQIPPNA
ncbi:MAG TPA: two-component system sensor histidine kinase CreC [Cellvibrionaceae bacterium]